MRQNNCEIISVLHLTDTLELGGAERMAVSLVNHISRQYFRAFLCTTRYEGPLKNEIKPDVGYLCLNRKYRFDIKNLFQVINFIKKNNIEVIHAHSFSLFLGAIITLFLPHKVKLIWHDHYGLINIQTRKSFYYRPAVKRCHAVIAVNSLLVKWAQETLSARNVFYIPNFADTTPKKSKDLRLPGKAEKRIICVANLRPEKDHETLLNAMYQVSKMDSEAHLILVGAAANVEYADKILNMIRTLHLEHQVTWLGVRDDVPDLLRHCTIGVLSSKSEGLPVSLMEYGTAGLAVVATNVGQCAELIQNNETGILTESGNASLLAEAMLRLLDDPLLRNTLGNNFLNLIHKQYSAQHIISQVEDIYNLVLTEK